MITFGNKQICEYCLTENCGEPCRFCGFDKVNFKKEAGALAPGSVLSGRYIVGKIMGKGGFGITYLAYDIKLEKKVALKEYFPVSYAMRDWDGSRIVVSGSEDEKFYKNGMEKFYEEASLVSSFNGNPNIVSVYEFFYENDTAYFVMELLQGCSLKSYIEEHGCLSPEQALYVADKVSSALLVAHSTNILHRDISPDNIMLCEDGKVKLIDFGAARQVAADNPKSMSVILKQGFAPLEQYQKRGNQGPWTDLYSLGATLYYAVTQNGIDDPMTRLDDDSDFQSNGFGIESELWAIIKTALNLKIDDRYKNAIEFREALGKISYKPQKIKLEPAEPQPEPVLSAVGAASLGQPVGNAQPNQPVGNVQPNPPVGNVQPNPPVDNAQPNPPVDNVQPNPPVDNVPPNPPVGNAQPNPPVNNVQPNPPVGNVQPDPPADCAQAPRPMQAASEAKKPRNKKLIAILSSVFGVVLVAGVIVAFNLINSSKKPNGSDDPPSQSAPVGNGDLTVEARVTSANTYASMMRNALFNLIVDLGSTGGKVPSSSDIYLKVKNGNWDINSTRSFTNKDGGNGLIEWSNSEIAAELGSNFTAVVYVRDGKVVACAYADTVDADLSDFSLDVLLGGVYEWDGNTNGVTDSGMVVGTYPKCTMS